MGESTYFGSCKINNVYSAGSKSILRWCTPFNGISHQFNALHGSWLQDSSRTPTSNLFLYSCSKGIRFYVLHPHHRPTLSKQDHWQKQKCVFVAYSATQKGYKCYHLPTMRFLWAWTSFFERLKACFEQSASFLQVENLDNEELMILLTSQILDEDETKINAPKGEDALERDEISEKDVV